MSESLKMGQEPETEMGKKLLQLMLSIEKEG